MSTFVLGTSCSSTGSFASSGLSVEIFLSPCAGNLNAPVIFMCPLPDVNDWLICWVSQPSAAGISCPTCELPLSSPSPTCLPAPAFNRWIFEYTHRWRSNLLNFGMCRIFLHTVLRYHHGKARLAHYWYGFYILRCPSAFSHRVPTLYFPCAYVRARMCVEKGLIVCLDSYHSTSGNSDGSHHIEEKCFQKLLMHPNLIIPSGFHLISDNLATISLNSLTI